MKPFPDEAKGGEKVERENWMEEELERLMVLVDSPVCQRVL